MRAAWWSYPAVSSVMCTLMAQLQKWAASDLTVLLLGETGTGKSMFARQIHAWSPRADRSFVEIDCGTIPDPLAEQEFFGSVKGAFTGATGKVVGRIMAAHGGTLLLDEIQNLQPRAQICLLGLFDTHTAHPLGSTVRVPLDVRTVVTSNQNLQALSQDHCFREDLYRRINTVTVTLPPLRTRREDIVPMAEAWLPHYARAARRETYPLSVQAKSRLREWAWPGNVRELVHCLERAVLSCTGPLTEPDDLFDAPLAGDASDSPASASPVYQFTPPARFPSYAEYRANTDRQYCRALLDRANGSRTRAAALSGLTRSTLHRLLSAYGDTSPD